MGGVAVQLHVFLPSALDRGEWLALGPCRFISAEISPEFIEQEAGLTAQQIWTFGEEKNMDCTGIQTPDCPTRNLVTIPTATELV